MGKKARDVPVSVRAIGRLCSKCPLSAWPTPLIAKASRSRFPGTCVSVLGCRAPSAHSFHWHSLVYGLPTTTPLFPCHTWGCAFDKSGWCRKRGSSQVLVHVTSQFPAGVLGTCGHSARSLTQPPGVCGCLGSPCVWHTREINDCSGT